MDDDEDDRNDDLKKREISFEMTLFTRNEFWNPFTIDEFFVIDEIVTFQIDLINTIQSSSRIIVYQF